MESIIYMHIAMSLTIISFIRYHEAFQDEFGNGTKNWASISTIALSITVNSDLACSQSRLFSKPSLTLLLRINYLFNARL
jgi:hypothetical protein